MENVKVLYSRYQMNLTDKQWDKLKALEEDRGMGYDSFINGVEGAGEGLVKDIEWSGHYGKMIMFSCSDKDMLKVVRVIEKNLGNK